MHKDKKASLRPRVVFSLLMAAAVVLFLALNLVVGLLAERLPAMQVDLTPGGAFQLSDETVENIQKLQEPVTIQVLAREDTFADTSLYNAQANAVMRQFAQNSAAITVEYVDFLRNPQIAAAHPGLDIKHGDILVESGGETALVPTEKLFNYGSDATGSVQIVSSRAEEAISSAIVGLTSGIRPLVVFTTGHEEEAAPGLESLLADNQYDLDTRSLLAGEIGDGADFVVVVAPTVDFGAEELDKLDAFLRGGGGKTLLYFAGADRPSLPNLEQFLREWGIGVGEGLVFETDENRVMNYQPFYPLADYADEEYTAMLANSQAPVLLPISRPLELVYGQRDGIVTRELLSFGGSAGVRPAEADDSFTGDDAESWGPMPAVALAELAARDEVTGAAVETSRVYAAASSLMVDAALLENAALNNAAFVLGLFSAASPRADVWQIQPRSLTSGAMNITAAEANGIGTVLAAVLPLLVLVTGVVVWLRRRRA